NASCFWNPECYRFRYRVGLDGMQVRKTSGNTIHHLHQNSSCSPGWPGTSGYDLWTGQKSSTKAADCYLCAQRAMVGAAVARSSLHTHQSRLYVEHGNSSWI